jgi:ribonuclease D
VTNYLHTYDLPDGLEFGNSIAIDTETKGLNNHRDRLCVVQISDGNGDAHLVHFPEANYEAKNLKSLLANDEIEKIFHFARFDVAVVKKYLGILVQNIFCTKISSRLVRTYTDHHGLKELCSEIAGVNISKGQQCSNWGKAELTPAQIKYAAQDVLFLHKIKEEMVILLQAENRLEVAQSCFKFLPIRAELDLLGWNEFDIFQH